MSGIHQVVPMLHRADAVGQHAVALQDLLRARGVASDIYVELEDPETAGRTRLLAEYPDRARAGDVLVYQFATASDASGWLATRPEAVVVNYHNVTPAPFFAPWDHSLALHQVRAQSQLASLAERAVLGVAVSEWNRADLVDAGFAATAVVPPVVALARPDRRRGAERHPSPGGRWLAVGRLAPNKAVEDTLAALLAYRRLHDPAATLTVVGRPAVPAYAAALHRYAADLGLAGAVTFAGAVDDDALVAAYDTADVLVVASEHEGFCLPVVEAMASGLPVVAYAEGAVPEVLGDAGVLLGSKDPVSVAAAAHRLASDPGWRADRVAAGRARVAALGLDHAGERTVDLLVAARDGGPWPGTVSSHPRP